MTGSAMRQAPAFVLYGAGNIGREVLRLLRGEGKNIPFFLDARAQPEMQVDGVAVLRPDQVPEGFRRGGVPVVITVFNRDADVARISALLHSLGWRNVISFVEFHAWYGDRLGDRFWLSLPGTLERDAERIAAAERLWADEASGALFRRLLAARRSGRATEMPLPDEAQTQYFPTDVPGWLPERPLRFVDCGAYTGDTLEVMARMALPLEAYAAFEPEIEQFRRLCQTVRAVLPQGVAGSLWPCGVSRAAELCRFSIDQGEGTSIVSGGTGREVPCVGLDEVLRGFRPTMIKMDIEGAEPDALEGARETIAGSRPRLAICVYHRPDHLWTIPLLIEGWKLGYRLHLRVHAYSQLEAVLYAV